MDRRQTIGVTSTIGGSCANFVRWRDHHELIRGGLFFIFISGDE